MLYLVNNQVCHTVRPVTWWRCHYQQAMEARGIAIGLHDNGLQHLRLVKEL